MSYGALLIFAAGIGAELQCNTDCPRQANKGHREAIELSNNVFTVDSEFNGKIQNNVSDAGSPCKSEDLLPLLVQEALSVSNLGGKVGP